VAGNRLYGSYPKLVVNSNDTAARDFSLSRGQYIPTTAIDQVAATLAKWMGVTDSAALNAMFPLLGNFSGSDLGFMG
ncbi:MAG: Tat pathway signal protein, partial [Candidatus Doudnabacteria bacterium]|nr:Tat pathway signal protein [Candidatus Doudnabacteria bacterium]